MIGRSVSVWLCLWFLVSVTAAAAGQVGAGALTGVVSDGTGQAVPGASVTATAVGTNQARTVITAADGGYSIHGLAPGEYRVRVELNGFQPAEPRRRRRRDRRNDPPRSPGHRRRSQRDRHGHRRRVSAPGRDVRTRTGHRQREDRRPAAERTELHLARRPRAGRGASARLARCRASTAAVPGRTSICSTACPCSSPSPARSRSSRTSTRFRSSRSRATAPPAEFGRFNGGVVNLTTKAGTNAFHGTAFEFLRQRSVERPQLLRDRRPASRSFDATSSAALSAGPFAETARSSSSTIRDSGRRSAGP